VVRYANRSKISKSDLKGSTPCATHRFPGGSLHAPYDPSPLLPVGKLTIKALSGGRKVRHDHYDGYRGAPRFVYFLARGEEPLTPGSAGGILGVCQSVIIE
jgi:hypothetical protein